MKQEMEKYTPEDEAIWNILFERQWKNLQDKASPAYLEALKNMEGVLNPHEVPSFEKINQWFENETGWSIACVPGLIPVDDFFELLANKQFCSSTWLRSRENLDYLEEPDMFHDIFGHVPLLSNPVFSPFLHEFGKLGVKIKDDPEKVAQLQRLYWFTIEFGLIEDDGHKIYGAGIASSFGESNLSVTNEVSTSLFDLETILNTSFETNHIQNHYFVIESYEQLFDAIMHLSEKWTAYAVENEH